MSVLATRPRHRHTPRVRRLAADTGVDLTSVAGTGPSGRVTTDDVRRAGLAAEPEPVVAPLTSVVEVDVTDALASGHPLTAHLATAVAGALAGPGGRVDLAVTGDGLDTVLGGAGDLSLDGVARRLAAPARAPGPATFTLVDAGHRGTLWETASLPAGQAAVLTAGAVIERPAVVRRADGERVVAVRAVVHLALTYDPGRLATTDAAQLLAAVRGRLTRST